MLAMTMDLSDYGSQAAPTLPSSSQAYDLTPLVLKSLKNFKPGTCGTTA
jgi:hypothetical protein